PSHHTYVQLSRSMYTSVVTTISHSLFLFLFAIFFFFNDTATTEIYTLSLHDALPISAAAARPARSASARPRHRSSGSARQRARRDRKSTRLNSSHVKISYAVFCLKKKKKKNIEQQKKKQRNIPQIKCTPHNNSVQTNA